MVRRLVLLVLSVLGAPLVGADVITDTLDPSQVRQEIEHFGASDCWVLKELAWSDAGKERLARLLFSREEGIGLSHWRFNLGAGDNPVSIAQPRRRVLGFADREGVYDWSRQAAERWYLTAAKRLGVSSFTAFANSPPAFLTANGLTNRHTSKVSYNLRPGAEPAYARYLADILDHFAHHPDPAQRLVFERVSPINEPEWEWTKDQEGSTASNADLRRVALAVGGELQRRKLATKLLLCESGMVDNLYQLNPKSTRTINAPVGNYIPLLAGDPELKALLGGVIAYHSYWSDSAKRLVAPRERARAVAATHGVRLWHSEYCIMEGGRDYGMDAALRLAQVVHHDLVVAEATAWSWWLAVSDEQWKSSLIYTDWKHPGDPESIRPTKMLWALGHWSRFVRPGMHRVALGGPTPQEVSGLLRSAYRGADGTLVAVYVNQRATACTVTLAGMPPTAACTRYVTSPDPGDDLRQIREADGAAIFLLPARSLTTVVWHHG